MNVEQLLGKCGFPPGAATGHLGAGWSVKFLVSDHSLHVLTSDFELVFSVAPIAAAKRTTNLDELLLLLLRLLLLLSDLTPTISTGVRSDAHESVRSDDIIN